MRLGSVGYEFRERGAGEQWVTWGLTRRVYGFKYRVGPHRVWFRISGSVSNIGYGFGGGNRRDASVALTAQSPLRGSLPAADVYTSCVKVKGLDFRV